MTSAEFRTAVMHLRNGGYFASIPDGALYLNALEQKCIDERTNTDVTPDATTLQNALTAANVVIAEENTLATAQEITLEQVKWALMKELSKASPDTTAVKNQLKAITDANPSLANGIVNIGALYSFDPATTVGYLRCALILVALMG